MSDRSGELDRRQVDADLRAFHRRYSAWLTARLRQRHGDEADDLVQETWLRVTPYLRQGAIEKPKAFLMTVVANLLIDRSRKRQPKSLLAADPQTSREITEEADQIELVLLKQIVMTMPDDLRAVFVLSRFVHLDYRQIGERLDIPVTTVQWRMSRAVAYCAAQLRR